MSKGQVICTLDLDSVWYNYETAQKNVQNARKTYDDQSPILAEQLSLAEKNLSDTEALFAIGVQEEFADFFGIGRCFLSLPALVASS